MARTKATARLRYRTPSYEDGYRSQDSSGSARRERSQGSADGFTQRSDGSIDASAEARPEADPHPQPQPAVMDDVPGSFLTGGASHGRSRTACVYWLAGNCRNGDSCSFAHDTLAQPPPCHFHLRGSCRYGDSCRFSHDAAAAGPSGRRQPHTAQPRQRHRAAAKQEPYSRGQAFMFGKMIERYMRGELDLEAEADDEDRVMGFSRAQVGVVASNHHHYMCITIMQLTPACMQARGQLH